MSATIAVQFRTAVRRACTDSVGIADNEQITIIPQIDRALPWYDGVRLLKTSLQVQASEVSD